MSMAATVTVEKIATTTSISISENPLLSPVINPFDNLDIVRPAAHRPAHAAFNLGSGFALKGLAFGLRRGNDPFAKRHLVPANGREREEPPVDGWFARNATLTQKIRASSSPSALDYCLGLRDISRREIHSPQAGGRINHRRTSPIGKNAYQTIIPGPGGQPIGIANGPHRLDSFASKTHGDHSGLALF